MNFIHSHFFYLRKIMSPMRTLDRGHQSFHQPNSPPTTKRQDLPLAAGGPHVADVAVTLGETVQGVIALAAGTDEAAQSVGLVLAGVAAVLVNLADGDLDGGVVVGLDDAVGGAALAGDVAGIR
jgi:hypothetical protein